MSPGLRLLIDTYRAHATSSHHSTNPSDHPAVWDDVYGFDMSCIKKLAMLEPLVDVVEAKNVVSYHPAPILEIDILTCTEVSKLAQTSNRCRCERHRQNTISLTIPSIHQSNPAGQADLAFESDFALTARRNDYVHALVAHFDCGFTQLHKPLHFSTGPFAKYTHWKQVRL